MMLPEPIDHPLSSLAKKAVSWYDTEHTPHPTPHEHRPGRLKINRKLDYDASEEVFEY
jgi:hypothetical protein